MSSYFMGPPLTALTGEGPMPVYDWTRPVLWKRNRLSGTARVLPRRSVFGGQSPSNLPPSPHESPALRLLSRHLWRLHNLRLIDTVLGRTHVRNGTRPGPRQSCDSSPG